MIEGKAWRFGDHLNTDLIIPGRYLDDYNVKNLASHAMEDADPEFAKNVRPGDILVAGRNFGCGSSREQAPLALKHAGVGAVVAGSFARIFYRNAINIGLPVVVCLQAANKVRTGDTIRIDLRAGTLEVVGKDKRLSFSPLPNFLLEILDDGGLVPYTRQKLGEPK